MAVTWTTSGKAAKTHGVRMLVHGKAGVGKTPLALTAPDPIIIAAEPGFLSLGIASTIPTAIIHNLKEWDEVYQYLAYSSDARARFKTVFKDSLTEIAESFLSDEKSVQKDPRKAYGNMQDEILKRVRWWRDLPGYHVCMIAKQEWVKDEVSGLTMYGPMMPGQKVGPALPYLFDEVFSMEHFRDGSTGSTFSALRCRPDIQFYARDRSGKLDQFEQPDLSRIIEKILGQPQHTGAMTHGS